MISEISSLETDTEVQFKKYDTKHSVKFGPFMSVTVSKSGALNKYCFGRKLMNMLSSV